MRILLTVACDVYDRTHPLQEGLVGIEGADVNYVAMSPGELFRRQGRYAEFDVAEFSLASHAILLGRGDERLVGLPIFTSRMFRHSAIYVRVGSGIKVPRDLAGRNVAVQEYGQTGAVWARAILQHEYGVSPSEMHWHLGGYEVPGFVPRLDGSLPSDITYKVVPSELTLIEALRKGMVDALIASRPPVELLSEGIVGRLFQNYREVEQEYFTKTSIFPIMHLVVMRRELYRSARWLAVNICNAFERSRLIGLGRTQRQSSLYCAVPWLESYVAEAARVVGEDPFRNGVRDNRETIRAFLGYCGEQGLLGGNLTVEDLFAEETHGWSA